MENKVPGVVYLKSGRSFKIKTDPDRRYDAKTLTDGTVLSFINGDTVYIVQGSNIDYIEVQL